MPPSASSPALLPLRAGKQAADRRQKSQPDGPLNSIPYRLQPGLAQRTSMPPRVCSSDTYL